VTEDHNSTNDGLLDLLQILPSEFQGWKCQRFHLPSHILQFCNIKRIYHVAMETAMVYLAYTTQLILVNHFYFPGKTGKSLCKFNRLIHHFPTTLTAIKL